MQTLIFDLDGTLADSKQSILESFRFALDHVGYRQTTYCEIEVTQQDLETSFRRICQKSSIEFESKACHLFIQTYRTHQKDVAEDLLRLFPKVPETLSYLRSHFKLGVATTKHTEQAVRVLRRLEIFDFFDHIQGTDSGLRYKPHPDILHESLKHLQADAKRAAYIGDSVHDMQAAKAASMIPIGAGYGFAGAAALKDLELPYLLDCISDLVSVSRAYVNANT